MRESISSGSVTIRRWRPDDAIALHEMIEESLDHLRPWMAWASTDTIAARSALVDEWGRAWDTDTEHIFAIVVGDRVVGSCGLHPRIDPDGREIGYWVRAGSTGCGVATAAVGALVVAAGDIEGVRHLEIRHDAANAASGRVADKAGFIRVGERRRQPVAPAESGREVIWRRDLAS